MIDDYHRKLYPDLFEAYDKREGDKVLRDKVDTLFKNIAPLRQALETYDEEEERGILHKREYQLKMESYRQDIPRLVKEAEKAMDDWRATALPYDPDNHVGSCGCIVKNGERVYWCGDHY